METPNPTLPANDIDLSKFVPAVGEDIPKPKRQIVDELIEEDEPEDNDPVILQKGPWEGAMNYDPEAPVDQFAAVPMQPPPFLALTNDQVDVAMRPVPTPAQLERQAQRQEAQQQKKTQAEKKAEEGIFIGAVKGLLGLEKKKQDAAELREKALEAEEKEAQELFELCKRLIQHFPTHVPKTDIRPGLRPSTYQKFIADAKFNLNSGRIFENGKATAKWASKVTEIGGSMVGLNLRGPTVNFSSAMSKHIDEGLFDDEIREVVVFYPHFFVRPLWLRVMEKIFFVAMAVHDLNSNSGVPLTSGPRAASEHMSARDMAEFAG